MDIKAIAAAINEAHEKYGWSCFGVRTGRATEVGETLERSYDWQDNVCTENKLIGTCSTGIGYLWFDGEVEDENTIEEAINTHFDRLYDGEMTYIVGGSDSEYGDDPGEMIICNKDYTTMDYIGANVIYIIK